MSYVEIMMWLLAALAFMPFLGACVVVPNIDDQDCAQAEGGTTGRLEIIAMDDVDTIPDPDTESWTISSDVTLVDAAVAGFSTWGFLEDTLIMNEEATDTGRVNLQIAGTIVGDSTTKRYILNKMNSGCCKFLVGLTTNDGLTYLVPNVKFRRNFTTGLGGDNDDRVQYDVAISKIGQPAYLYTGTFPRFTAV